MQTRRGAPASERRRAPRWADLRPFLEPPALVLRSSDRRLGSALTIADLERAARRRVPRPIWDYVQDGSESQLSARRNREAFERVELRPRAFGQVGEPDVTATLLGRPAELPIVLAPTGYTRLSHHTGETAAAAAAEAAGVPYTLSTYATTSIGDVALAAPGARRWFQVYLMKDRAVTEEHLAQARESGYEALMLTIDTTVSGQKLNDLRNGFAIPPRLTPRTFLSMARHPGWVGNVLTTRPLRFATFPEGSRYGVWGASNSVREQAIRPADIAWLRERWQGPVTVKGVLSVEDAVVASGAGADAVVLSNHGGRQLDRAPVPIELLPAVVDALQGETEVLVDSGVRTGGDIAAAIGLGARGVLIGRPYLYGLMAGGRRGVAVSIDILRRELVRTLQLLGVASLDELGPEHVRLRPE